MSTAPATLDAAVQEAERLSTALKRNRSQAQVRSSDERAHAKATALTWFSNHRAQIIAVMPEDELGKLDAHYKTILEASASATSRKKYINALKAVKGELIRARSLALMPRVQISPSSDIAPDFSPLIGDTTMQAILGGRWTECAQCIAAGVPLAATVMMGGLLEAILLARINSEKKNKDVVFKARAAPRDELGVTLMLQKWGLKDFIAVAHEMKWVSVSVKDVGEVLRDYRNYIHPYKQYTHSIHLTPDDATLLWDVTKNITRQVIKSAGK